jgi:phosphomevalonate kinase
VLTVRAPGKVILLGEYAVLGDAPALVAAVDRLASCTVVDGPGCRIEAPALGCACDARAPLAGDKLDFARAAIATAGETPPGVYRLDSEDLAFRGADGGRHKLGLGGSAATTVALLAAVAARAGRPVDAADVYARAQRAHHRVQGRGSGADVAASAFGGLLAYRWFEGRAGGDLDAGCGTASVERLPIAGLPSLSLVWTGQSASTPALVERVWALGPARLDALLAPIATAAERGIAAVRQGHRPGLVEAAGATAEALAALGAAAGATLVTPVHGELAALARPFGVVVKPTGAGGGDLAWLVGPDDAAEGAAAEAVRAAGHVVLRMRVSARGVHAG